jgi:hypothetical protein
MMSLTRKTMSANVAIVTLASRSISFRVEDLHQEWNNNPQKSGTQMYHIWAPYATVRKGPEWKDPTIEINCIPPQLNMWYMVVCICGIGGIGVLLVVFSWWHKQNI